MQSFLNKVGKTATAAANKAGNKASEMIEVGKLKGKISSQKQDINTAKRDIGEYCYELFKDEKIDDDRIKELCAKIEAAESAIAELEVQIDAVREEYKAKNENESSAE